MKTERKIHDFLLTQKFFQKVLKNNSKTFSEINYLKYNMSNEEFLDASKKGDAESVRRLLASKAIDINFKDI